MATGRITKDFSTKNVVMENATLKPRTILLFSGKRKCGKDYITNALQERIGPDNSVIIKLSGPIKSHWAKSLGLDLDLLMGDGEYKENFRLEMAKWGENVRKEDYGYFCRAAINMYNADCKSIWIISDVRRKTDVQWFLENFKDACKTICITSDKSVREKRGWIFTPGIDDSETECDLDDVNTWNLKVTNNDDANLESILQSILKLIT